jgi:hypothetical protein
VPFKALSVIGNVSVEGKPFVTHEALQLSRQRYLYKMLTRKHDDFKYIKEYDRK